MIWLLPHPPACPYHFPCPGSNGKAKMHQLYCQWLSCKGQWEKCALVISFKKQHVKDSEELYQFLPRSAIVKEYGEDLADDLIARHKAAEAKLPANQKNQFIKPSLISKYICILLLYLFLPILARWTCNIPSLSPLRWKAPVLLQPGILISQPEKICSGTSASPGSPRRTRNGLSLKLLWNNMPLSKKNHTTTHCPLSTHELMAVVQTSIWPSICTHIDSINCMWRTKGCGDGRSARCDCDRSTTCPTAPEAQEPCEAQEWQTKVGECTFDEYSWICFWWMCSNLFGFQVRP